MNELFEPVVPDEVENPRLDSLHKEVDPIFDNIADELDSNIEPVAVDENTNTSEVEEVNVEDTASQEQTTQTEEGETEKEASIPTPPEDINYEDFYKEMMSPIKANGKTFSLQSAQEARQLIQMGANYTKKMQEIAPQRKILEFLKKNNINTENDILYLVDLANGNEAAIQKLIQDKNIDINNISSSDYDDDGNVKPVQYIPTQTMPDDKYMSVTTVLEDIQQTQDGKDFMQEVLSWDSSSRNYLYDHPEVLYNLKDQKQNGIFDTISSEIDRRRVVGSIPSTMDFITAYAQVGTELNNQGRFNYINNKPIEQPVNNVVTRPYIQHGNTTMQHNTNNNAAQVKSAGLTRMDNSTPKPATKNTAIQSLYKQSTEGALSGDDFVQQFNKLFKINN